MRLELARHVADLHGKGECKQVERNPFTARQEVPFAAPAKSHERLHACQDAGGCVADDGSARTR
eukprot:2823451-Alexandrium_andersonii.AAC.1